MSAVVTKNSREEGVMKQPQSVDMTIQILNLICSIALVVLQILLIIL